MCTEFSLEYAYKHDLDWDGFGLYEPSLTKRLRAFKDCMPHLSGLNSLKTLTLCLGGNVSATELTHIKHLPLTALSLNLMDGDSKREEFVFTPSLASVFSEMKQLRKLFIPLYLCESVRKFLHQSRIKLIHVASVPSNTVLD